MKKRGTWRGFLKMAGQSLLIAPVASSPAKSATVNQAKNLANLQVKRLKARSSGFTGSLLSIHNVSGMGVNDAATIDPPKIPDPAPTPIQPYQLR